MIWDDLAAYWKLDEPSGSRADSFGTSHLTDVNTVGTAAGKQDMAGQFVRASAEHLTIADNAALSLGSSSLTVAAWVYFDTKPPASTAIVGKQDGTNLEYQLWYEVPVDRLTFSVWWSGGESRVWATTLGSPATATWYFVVSTFDATTRIASISVNDGPVDSGGATSGTGNDTTVAFMIGTRSGSVNYWDGRIDEVGLWKRALSATERTELYNGGAGLTYSPEEPPIEPPVEPPSGTRQKRSSAISMLGWPILAPPAPDGALDRGDRQHGAHEYASLAVVLPEQIDWLRTAIAQERSLQVAANPRSTAVRAVERALTVVAEPTRRTGP